MLKRISSLVLALLIASSPSLFAATYKIDNAHSDIGFRIKHLFSHVKGQFDEYEGTIEYDPENPLAFKAQGTVKAQSIDTNVAKRDEHLRSADFFDTTTYPELTFESTDVQEVGEGKLKVKGNITIHGVTKEATFDVEIHGTGKDPWGNMKLGLTATTTVNRKDFGLGWNQVLETGGVLVGDEVQITLELEANAV